MYLAPQPPEALAAAIAAIPRPEGAPVLVLVGETDAPDLDALVAALTASGVEFAGGLFPGLLTDEGHREAGVVALPLPKASAPVVIPGLGTGDFEGLDSLDLPEGGTAFVFVDGLATHVGGFLAALFHRAGASVTYVGGGAGSLSLQPAPCLFTREGVVQDAALIVPTPEASTVGVRHGWARLAGPLVATQTQGPRVEALNWEPALEVYRRAVEPDAGRDVTPEDFFSVAKGYPFGISREGQEDVVRDPITVDG
ncbi:MAG: FIST N-terminal domain-containing protein, partial [Bacteroidota bacterium]